MQVFEIRKILAVSNAPERLAVFNEGYWSGAAEGEMTIARCWKRENYFAEAWGFVGTVAHS